MILLAVTLSTVFVASVQAAGSPSVNPTVATSPSTQSAVKNNMCGFKINPTATTSATVPKNLTYACQPNGTIVIKGSQFNTIMVNVKVLKPVSEYPNSCSKFKCNQSSSDVTISGCDRGTPVLIVLDTARDAQTIYGGNGEKSFTLTCEKKFSATINKTAKLFLETFAPDHLVTNILPHHTMLVTSTVDNTTEIPSTKVGTELSLVIKTTDTYYIQVLSCKAISGNNAGVSTLTIDLWKTTSKDTDIFGNFWTGNGKQHQISANFFAFRFKDSATVVFQCEVKFCYASPCIQGAGRKRRDTNDEHNHNIRTLEQSLIVTDVYSGSAKAKYSSVLAILILMSATRWLY